MLVSVITATTGNPLLKQTVQSVQNQDYKNIEHIIVIDGQERENDSHNILKQIEFKKRTYAATWPYATGKDRFNGHRIYGANCYLANGDYLVFLDEDNWLDENHISSLVELVSKWQLDWAYSLRKIVDRQGNFITYDDCESLGKWPSFLNEKDYLVDVNCYFLKKQVAIAISPLWYRRAKEAGLQDVDRAMCANLIKLFPNFETTGLYTVNYRVSSTAISMNQDFFIRGNKIMQEKYPQEYPWRNSKWEVMSNE